MVELAVVALGMAAMALVATLTIGYVIRFLARRTWSHASMLKAAFLVSGLWAALAMMLYLWMAVTVYR